MMPNGVPIGELSEETKLKLGLSNADVVVSPRIKLLGRILVAVTDASQREAMWALARAREVLGKAADADRKVETELRKKAKALADESAGEQ